MGLDLGLSQVIGLWGIFKDVASYAYRFFRRYDKKSDLRVEIEELPVTREQALELSLLDCTFTIKVKNFDNHDSTLASRGLFVVKVKRKFPPLAEYDPVPLDDRTDRDFPRKLSAYDSYHVDEPLRSVHRYMWAQNFSGVIDVVAYFRDSLDRVYYSGPYPYYNPFS